MRNIKNRNTCGIHVERKNRMVILSFPQSNIINLSKINCNSFIISQLNYHTNDIFFSQGTISLKKPADCQKPNIPSITQKTAKEIRRVRRYPEDKYHRESSSDFRLFGQKNDLPFCATKSNNFIRSVRQYFSCSFSTYPNQRNAILKSARKSKD